MEFLANALDDENPQRCGICASCLGGPIINPSVSHSQVVSATRYLRHSEMPLACNKQVARDAFPEYGFHGNLPQGLRAETGRILSRWGDAGWGQIVAEDKHGGRFRDDLVDAIAEMTNERWSPYPAPEWITSVPSHNHPDLLPDFAGRLGERLGLRFIPAVTKLRNNEPQKLQENRFHQCRNLDGVFRVEAPIPRSPVLLVDDVIDSGWTMTVIAALLLQAGCDCVWPVALATSSLGS